MSRVNIYSHPDPEDPYGPEEPKVEGWFDPAKAVEAVEEDTRWDGSNNVSIHGGRWEHEKLYRTPGGRWVLNHWSQWEGGQDTYRFLGDQAAKQWLLVNGSDSVIEKYFGELAEEAGPGRPEIGGVVNTRLGDLLPLLDVWAEENGMKRAEAIREAVRRMVQADA